MEGYIEKPKDIITSQVMEDLKSRADRGLKKYNTTLHDNNKDDFMNHAYEEALDLAQYLKKEMSIIPILKQTINQYPNDIELGKIIRQIYG
jgi:lantibiotic modifying enzyme